MTFGSLFAGIGGMDLGLERAGMTCKWQVELDPFCQKVLAKHWPHVKRYGDIRTVGSELEPVDLIAGGFPCQDVSCAGTGAGIDGARSGLWSEMLRIIRLVRPRFVLVENVSALLTRGIERVLGQLAESGYDAEWQSLPAAAFGAPHIRDRVFIVAYADGQRKPQPEGLIQNVRRWACHGGQDVADAAVEYSQWRLESDDGEAISGWNQDAEERDTDRFEPEKRSGADRGLPSAAEWWRIEPAVGRMAHGVPHRVDRLKGLGNAVVPQVAEWIGRRILEAATPQAV